MATKPPVEVPQGAIRLNTDSQKMEFFAQDQWWEMATDVPTLNRGSRALFAGMTPNASTATDAIDYITISTTGNAADFGNLSATRMGCASFASRSRGIFYSGYSSDVIDYVTIASTGNATDFGNAQTDSSYMKGLSNQTRGINAGGWRPSIADTIDYITIASTGNANDFGNLDQNIGGGPGGGASSTRGVFSGGYNPSPALTALNVLQYITIATTGNTHDFGDLSVLRTHNGQATSSTRSVVAMGYNKTPSTGNYDNQATSEYFTFATLGNSVNFGDMIATGISPGATSDSVRGVYAGGSSTNTIQYISIATQGDAVDFGDMVTSGGWFGGCSNGHGGL